MIGKMYRSFRIIYCNYIPRYLSIARRMNKNNQSFDNPTSPNLNNNNLRHGRMESI